MFGPMLLLASSLPSIFSSWVVNNPCEVRMQQEGARVVGFYDGQFDSSGVNLPSFVGASFRNYSSSGGTQYRVYYVVSDEEKEEKNSTLVIVKGSPDISFAKEESVLAHFKVSSEKDRMKVFDAAFDWIEKNEEIQKLITKKKKFNHAVEVLIRERNAVALFGMSADPYGSVGYWGVEKYDNG